jgi:hypothetical protein
VIRAYFNRHEEAPQVWSVDEGSHESEVCVQGISTLTVGKSNYNPDAEFPAPKAWLEFHNAYLDIRNGIAYIKPLGANRIEHRP